MIAAADDPSLVPPSGEQIDIALGDQRATIVGFGGGLRQYTVAGRDILDGYGLDEMCTSGRGQVLMPWPNRIRDGRYVLDGDTQQLALTEPANHNAIHGLVRWATWTVRDREADRVVMEHVIHPQPGFPFALELGIEYALSASGLRVRTSARNVGRDRCPFGLGAHPYLTVGVAPIDDVVLAAPGRTHLTADHRGIPTGRVPVEGTALDLRIATAIGDVRLDDCFTDLDRDADGLAWVHLAAQTGRRVSLWMDEAYGHLMIFTGDTLAVRARHSVAVEPMTCAPDAFNSGDGRIILEPGATFSGAWGLVADRPSA